MNKDINLGQVDQNGFKESQSVNLAKLFLEKNKKVKTHFMEMDKTPNFDGKLMIMAGLYERITVEVQIKTLPKNTRKKENGDFSFTCDTKAMNCVKENVTFNPVALLAVDISNMQLYYKILTKEYVSDLKIGNQKAKNIWLSEKDEYQEDKFIKQIYHQVKITNADESCLTKCAAIRESLNNGEKETKEYFELVYEREDVKGFFTTFKYCYGENKEKSLLLSQIKMQYKDEGTTIFSV
ncbi:hypothetical protein [Pelosinus sp. IPA-1]|uniref:hypothetical protein n=1 Tax=Pelosinus sp. IPA-1 TaxID=3029569 RepID=UPI0024361AE2|nr:hypothetical protein [Pelosinus sp. IPA-1]GMB01094.1 hypothetical protein PIPA1_38930 [Pelosinus sp. IPA-1]